jgi:hypothetical protein
METQQKAEYYKLLFMKEWYYYILRGDKGLEVNESEGIMPIGKMPEQFSKEAAILITESEFMEAYKRVSGEFEDLVQGGNPMEAALRKLIEKCNDLDDQFVHSEKFSLAIQSMWDAVKEAEDLLFIKKINSIKPVQQNTNTNG